MPAPLVALATSLVPSLAGWIFGKGGEAVAETVVDAAKHLFGTDDKDEIEKAIAAKPELAWEFKSKLLDIRDREAERAHMERMKEIDDIQNARAAQASTQSAVTPTIAISTVILFFVSNGLILVGAYFAMTSSIEVKNVELALAVAAIVGGVVTNVNSKADQVFGFFFGSSVSARSNSQATQVALADIAKAATRK
jgi:hypothetical protein